jgi:DNA-directed RNA polymerase specialized sigma subunit
MLTHDLLLRATHAQPAESHALQFRALHLNLPTISEVADRLRLSSDERDAVEEDALNALLRAIEAFDPEGGQDFADFSLPFVEGAVARRAISRRTDPASRR